MGKEPKFIVGIGASAGGLQAVSALLTDITCDATTAFILVMHLNPDRISHMAELLQRTTRLTVVEVRERTRLVPDHVYVLSPGHRATLVDTDLELEVLHGHPGTEMLIDVLFLSMAAARGERCAGIALSGGGNDGAAGLNRIMAVGGLALVQAPDEAEFDAMPLAALEATTPASAHPVNSMPRLLADYAAQLTNEPVASQAGIQDSNLPRHDSLSRLRRLMSDATGVDFELYKGGTLRRRAERRMLLNGCGWDSYIEKLADDAAELDALYEDVLIGVTGFFRDPEAWERLAAELPHFTSESGPAELRAWVAGCASGEEAYSLAIVLDESLDNSRRPIQIFATDLSALALQRARQGFYSAHDLEHVSAERVERYFQKHNGHYRIKAALRETVTFAQHDLLHDAPFSRMDIVTCRNLLIYFKPDAHSRVLRHLHFALRRGGLLMTGRSETISPRDPQFEHVSKPNGLYRAYGPRATDLHAAGGTTADRAMRTGRTTLEPLSANSELKPTHSRIERFVLEKRTLACVVIDKEFQILHYYGPTERYLAPPSGAARRDLPSWVRSGLFIQLHAVLRGAVERQERVSVKGHMNRDGQTLQVRCTAEPIPGTGEENGLLLVSFDDLPVIETAVQIDHDEEEEPVARLLERELRDTRSELDLATFQLQSAVEEYRSNHEEMMSLNEELLSSNEELEAAKEEQESLNEEMATVLQETAGKNAQLKSANEDLQNLFSSTGIPTIFLDLDLKVRRFTPSVEQVMHLVEGDLERSIEHIKERYASDQITETARLVIDEKKTITTEVQVNNGKWYRRVMAPYLSAEKQVCGVCITFEDVTSQKLALNASDAARIHAESTVRTVRTPVLIVNNQYRVVSCNPAFVRLSGIGNRTIDGMSLEALEAEDGWIYRSISELVQRVLRERQPLQDIEIQAGDVSLLVNADIMADGDGIEQILVAFEDVTLHRDFQQASIAHLAEQHAESVRKDEWIAMLGHELRNPLGAVSTAVSLLSAGIDSEQKRQQIVDLMQRQMHQVNVLLDSLLDAARIVAGKFEIDNQPIDLVELLSGVVEAHRLILEPQQSLELEIHTTSDVIVLGDRTRLIEVADNLLANASKYTPPDGEIKVSITASDGWGQFTVQDNGMGISAAFLPRIFEMFTQGDRDGHTGLGLGLGLGLSLAKRLVELHNGEIKASSDGRGHGSRFEVRLPLTTEALTIPVEEAAPTTKQRKILVVDDNVDAADVIVQLLQLMGHDVRIAYDGPTALALIEEFDAEIVLLDIGMPEMDGYDVAAKLRAQSEKRHIIALTGYRRNEEQLQAAGFDDHLSKPLRTSQLRQVLADLNERQSER